MNDEEKKRAVRLSLPDFVEENGLFRTEAEKRQGIFHCPCCDGKLGLYIKKKGVRAGEPAFGKLSCACSFESYDIFGLYGAMNGLSNSRAVRALMKGESADAGHLMMKRDGFRKMTERKREASPAGAIIRKSTLWGDAMPDIAVNALKSRGLDIEELKRSGIYSRIGWVPGAEATSMGGKKYTVRGIAFDKGNGMKIRLCGVDGSFVKDKGWRFLSYDQNDGFGVWKDKSDPAFIVEGEFDMLSIISHGFPSMAVSGCMNKGGLERMMEECSPSSVYIMAFDDDKAGQASSVSMVDLIRGKGGKAFSFPLNGIEHDVNDLQQKNPSILEKRLRLGQTIGAFLRDGVITEKEADEYGRRLHAIDLMAASADKKSMEEWHRMKDELNDRRLAYGKEEHIEKNTAEMGIER